MSDGIDTSEATSVTRAIETRRSVREFLDRAVPREVVHEILDTARRAASGGNLQPWRVVALAGDARQALVDRVAEKAKETPFGDGPEYDIYPHDLAPPYTTRRSRVAAEMYELVGIARDDQVGRVRQMSRNFDFFGAPVGIILSIGREMGPPQFADLGIFLQSVMLLARERGLHTCPQEAWSLWGATIREVVGIPEEELIFCGLSLGYADESAAINRLQTDRADVADFARFQGF